MRCYKTFIHLIFYSTSKNMSKFLIKKQLFLYFSLLLLKLIDFCIDFY